MDSAVYEKFHLPQLGLKLLERIEKNVDLAHRLCLVILAQEGLPASAVAIAPGHPPSPFLKSRLYGIPSSLHSL